MKYILRTEVLALRLCYHIKWEDTAQELDKPNNSSLVTRHSSLVTNNSSLPLALTLHIHRADATGAIWNPVCNPKGVIS
jgi:hypothetical protein